MREPFDSMAEAGFSEACERNKDFILKVLKKTFTNGTTILEIDRKSTRLNSSH